LLILVKGCHDRFLLGPMQGQCATRTNGFLLALAALGATAVATKVT